MPKVSVIIPTHNRSKYLHSAVTSVPNQTYQDFEIIIVDDASNDNTPEVIASISDARIKYIRHEHSRGDGGARNSGIRNAIGEYIGFLDDDDQWLPKKLELQAAVLDGSPLHVGGVYTGQFNLDGLAGKILSIYRPTRRGDLSHYLFTEGCIVTSSVLFRKQCFDRVGLFDETIPYCNDYDMWIRIAKEFHFECLEKPLLRYLVHPDKLSGNFQLSIKGREMVLQKYRSDFSRYPKAYAQAYRVLGEVYCYDGNVKKGREAFLKAVNLYPFEFRSYCHYCFSLFGAKNFRFLRETLQRVLAPLRARRVKSELRKLALQMLL